MYTSTKRMLAFCLIAFGLCVIVPRIVTAQSSDLEQVKAANAAYYAALSARDLHAMEQVWTRTSRDVNIAPPIRPAAHIGWDLIKKNYLGYWGTLDELAVSMAEPSVEVQGTVAWVYGIEHAKRRAKNGQTSGGRNFGTSIFVKESGGWKMIFHQAALIPNPN